MADSIEKLDEDVKDLLSDRKVFRLVGTLAFLFVASMGAGVIWGLDRLNTVEETASKFSAEAATHRAEATETVRGLRREIDKLERDIEKNEDAIDELGKLHRRTLSSRSSSGSSSRASSRASSSTPLTGQVP